METGNRRKRVNVLYPPTSLTSNNPTAAARGKGRGIPHLFTLAKAGPPGERAPQSPSSTVTSPAYLLARPSVAKSLRLFHGCLLKSCTALDLLLLESSDAQARWKQADRSLAIREMLWPLGCQQN